MGVETLVEWMLRRHEEIARDAATADVRHTLEYLKRKLQNVYRMRYGYSEDPPEKSIR